MRITPAIVLVCSLIFSTAQAEPTAEEMNAAIGAPLFADDSLWDDQDSAVARRINWERESETSYSSSFRLYADEKATFLGARPYSLVLYGWNGKPASISVVFANKGDYGNLFSISRVLDEGTASGRQRADARRQERQALAGLDKAIDQDGETIEKALSALLGKPSNDKFGQGQGLRERVQRWDWKGHAFLLSKQDNYYLGLRIVPAEAADNGGKDARINDVELKQMLKSRVERRPNGDVVITQLPMVDQGPKGFCVPATMERYLRFLGIQTDMYVLALAAQTGAGGGTNIGEIEAAITPLVRSNLRKLESVPPAMKINSLSKQIDDGLPIIWGLLVDRAVDKQLTHRAVQRKNTTDWKAWKEVVKPARREANRLKPPRENGHVCLIIGYNKETDELAISDSWGPEYAERWITLEEAEALSVRYLRVISW